MKQSSNLKAVNVAFLFVGAIMGAGFASGREIWQFFGVFGPKGRIGVLIVSLLFMTLGIMTSYIARVLNTNHMGRVIVPGGNPKICNFISYFMAFILFTILINMTAAGGALFHQQFGISRVWGGILVGALVILTVLGEFERISKVFKYIMPVLFAVVVLLSILIIFSDLDSTSVAEEVKPSPMASNWLFAAFIYISYNILSFVPIIATAAVNSRSSKSALCGAGLGGLFLGILAFAIVSALQIDMPYSQSMDMPMLGYSSRLSGIIGIAYTIILFSAIYASATSNYYGFTTKIKDGPNKNKIVILAAILAFTLGLVGFKNVVAYMFPIEGYLGFAIVIMIVINFIKVFSEEKHRKKEENDKYFKNYPGEDRYNLPAPLIRVTGGAGGEAFLIKGSEKNALYDCGMACFNNEIIKNIENELEASDGKLDYILISHTHYDHVGALPYILKRWPDAKVLGNEKASKVFASAGARNTMKILGENARKLYGRLDVDIITDGLKIDNIIKDGDKISLGNVNITAYESKGHTDCSMTYFIQPQKILLTSESTGVFKGDDIIQPSVLKDFDSSIETAERLKKLNFDYLISPHYGIIPKKFNSKYFELYISEALAERDLIITCIKEGMSDVEIFEKHKSIYWTEARGKVHPFEAYKINTETLIKQVRMKYTKVF